MRTSPSTAPKIASVLSCAFTRLSMLLIAGVFLISGCSDSPNLVETEDPTSDQEAVANKTSPAGFFSLEEMENSNPEKTTRFRELPPTKPSDVVSKNGVDNGCPTNGITGSAVHRGFSGINNAELYTFNGSAGDAITIEVHRLSSAMDPVLILYRGTYGGGLTFVASADDNNGIPHGVGGSFADPKLVMTLPATGVYTLAVWDFLGAGPGPTTPFEIHTSGISCVTNAAPVADAGGPYAGTEGAAVSFDGSGSSDDGSITGYEWDFDYDGATFDVDGTGINPSHSYADNGTYTVALRVTDDAGAVSGVATTTAEIANVAPSVDAGADAVITSGSLFDLSGTFSDPGVNDAPWSYAIDWGNGSTGNGSTSDQSSPIEASQQYCAVGVNSVALTVTDKDNGSGSDELSLTVQRQGVAIDIKPGGDPNSISLQGNRKGNANGVIPVAILSDGTFDAAQVDPATVTLGNGDGNDTPVRQRNNGSLMASLEDVDLDGDLDLVLHFDQNALIDNGDLDSSTTSLTVHAGLSDGCVQIGGSDSVQIVR